VSSRPRGPPARGGRAEGDRHEAGAPLAQPRRRVRPVSTTWPYPEPVKRSVLFC
jgi:hypothetical protein